MFGAKGLAYATAALTIITLFFGELLPKVRAQKRPLSLNLNFKC
jgi:Mg2+/Co2+ transporter CorB